MSTEGPDLEEFRAAADAAEAARSRSRQRWMRQQAAEETDLRALLAHVAMTGSVVAVATMGGRMLRGRVVRVGLDYGTLQTVSGVAHIRLDGITTLRTGGRIEATGRAWDSSTFADVLADAAADQPWVVASVRGQDEPLAGELVAVGPDLIALRTAADDQFAYVVLASLTDVSVP